MSDLAKLASPTVVPIRRPEGPTRDYSCSNCAGTGNVLCERTDNPGPFWVFRCSCSAGNRRRSAYPLWDARLISDYTILEQQKYDPSGWAKGGAR